MNALLKKSLAEFIGVASFLTAIMASQGTLKVIALAMTLGLMVLVTGPVSGGHLNPAVSLYFYAKKALTTGEFLAYVASQLAGALAGVYLASVLTGTTVKGFSAAGMNLPTAYIAGEIVATAGLVWIIGTLVQHDRAQFIPVAVTTWVASAATFTVTGAQANPAVTLGVMLNGLAVNQGAVLVLAELAGLVIAMVLLTLFAPVAKKTRSKK